MRLQVDSIITSVTWLPCSISSSSFGISSAATVTRSSSSTGALRCDRPTTSTFTEIICLSSRAFGEQSLTAAGVAGRAEISHPWPRVVQAFLMSNWSWRYQF